MADKEIKFVLSAQDRTASAIDGLRSRMSGLQGGVDALNSGFSKLGLVFGPAFAAGTLVAFIKGTAEGIDKLNDLRDATGASIGNLSALEDVARRGGSSFEDMSSVLVKFNKGLNESAEPGSKVAQLLKELGLSAAELKAIDPAEALRRTAVAFESYADDGNKARAFQELFGKSVQEAGKLMHDLGTQTTLVATVTEQAAAEAKRLNDQIDGLNKNSTDLARTFAGPFIRATSTLIEYMLKAKVATSELFKTLRDEESNESKVAAEQSRLERIETLNKLLATGNLTLERRVRLQNQLAGLELRTPVDQQSQDRAGETRGRLGAKPSLRIPGAAGKTEAEQIDANRQALAAYVAQQGKELEKNQQLSDEQKALNLLKSIGTLGQVPQVRELVLGLAAQNDELENQAALKRLNIDVDKERERQQKQIDDFASGGGTTAAKVRAETEALTMNAKEIRRRTELDRLDQEVQRASLGITGERRDQILALAEAMREDLVRAIDAAEERQNALNASFSDGAAKALDAYVQSADNKSKQAEDFVTRGINNMEDALVQFATTGKTSFRSLANSIISDLLRIQARAAISGILKYINGGSSAYNYTGDTSGSLFSATGADIAGRRAMGGPVSAGSTYLVGEQGPELLTLGGTGGNVTPNSALGKSPGTVFDFSGQTINVGQGASRAEVYAAVQQGNAQTEKRIRRLIAQGSFA